MQGKNAARINVAIGAAFSSKFKTVTDEAKDRINDIGQEMRRLTASQKLLGDSIQTFGRMGKNVDGLREKYAAVTREIEKQRVKISELAAKEAQRAENLAKRSELQGQIGGAVAGTTATAFPLVAAGRSASAAQYEIQMIANTAEMSSKQIGALGAAITDASRQTGQSAPQMRQAMAFLVAAGMDIKTAEKSLIQIGRTATASGAGIEDLSKAAFVLTDTLNIAPGQALEDALDTLAQAGKQGNVELRDMAAVLPVLGSGFQALKMDGREAAATMGAALQIARKGAGSADEAANNMQNFIAKVMSPETLKKAQEDFGLDLYAVISKAQKQGGNPFEASVKAIMDVTKGDQKKIGELFGDMQVQNFIRPMIQNYKEYEQIKKKSLTASGVTDKDFATVMATAKEQSETLREEVGRLGEAIGMPLALAFGTLSAAITPVIVGITQFATENPKLTAGIIGVVTALSAARLAMILFRLGWTFLSPVLTSVLVPLTRLGATVLPMLGRAFMVLGRAMLMNPIGLALTAIGVAAFLLWKNWDTVVAGISKAWTWLSTNAIAVWGSMKSWFSSIPGQISGFFSELPGKMLAIGGQIIDGLVNGVKNKWDGAKAYFSSLPGQISGGFKSVLGIKSPSRVFASIGDDTIAGLEVGLGRSAPGVLSQMGGIARSLAMPIAATASLSGAPVAASAVPSVVPSSVSAPAAAGGVSASASNVYNITVNGGGDGQAIAAAIRAELGRIEREKMAARRSRMTDSLGL